MWRVARVRLFVSLLHWVRVFHMVLHGPCVRPHLLDSRLIFSACLSPLLVCPPPFSPLPSPLACLISCPPLLAACLPPPPVSPACLSHLLLLSACLSPLLLLPSPVSSAWLSPLPSAPPCLSVFSACLPLAAVALHRCDGSDREPEGAAQRRQVGAVRPRAAPPMLLSSTFGGGGRQAAHTAQCGCSRHLAAVVLPRHSCGGQRPKGYSSERLPYGQ